MTDDARLDARVRSVLTDLPVPDDADTRDALHAVLARSRRPRRDPRGWITPVLVAAAVLALAVLAGTLVDRPSTIEPAPPPASGLVGDWQRQVTGARTPGWDGRWRLAFTDDGVLTLSGPQAVTASSEGASYAVTDGRLRVDVFVNSVCPEMSAGVYAIDVSADTLTLSAFEDPCPVRADVLVGSWRRVS